MKKLFYLLFLLPLGFLASCNNDDDFPEVELTVTLSNVYQDATDGKFYYVENEESSPVVDGITAKSLIGGKQAAIANVVYHLNGIIPLFGTEENPFSAVVPVNGLREGENYINIAGTLLQEDKSMVYCYVDVPLNAVEETEDLPDNIGEVGTYTMTLRMQPKK